MQKFMPYLLLAGLAVVATWALKQGTNAAALARVVPSLVGVDYKFPATLQLRLKFSNPTNTPAKISGLSGVLYFNSQAVGTVVVNTVVSIPALGEMIVPVNVNFTIGNAVELIQNIAFMIEGSYVRQANFKLVADVYVDQTVFPLTLNYSL